MTKQKREEWARYLEKDGEVRLFGADQLEDAAKDGWKEPTGVRGNGLPWNETVEEGDGEPAAESAARVQADADKRKAERAQREAEKVTEQMGEPIKLEDQPDQRIEIVTKDNAAAKTTARKSAK